MDVTGKEFEYEMLSYLADKVRPRGGVEFGV